MSEGGTQYSRNYQPKLLLQYESVCLSTPPPPPICLFIPYFCSETYTRLRQRGKVLSHKLIAGFSCKTHSKSISLFMRLSVFLPFSLSSCLSVPLSVYLSPPDIYILILAYPPFSTAVENAIAIAAAVAAADATYF